MPTPALAPTERFTDRVDDYVRHRPGYPPALIDWLLARTGLQAGERVADVGAGTGIFTEALLRAGLRVAAVEPNAAMRAAAERRFAGQAGFEAVEGSAERSGLAAASVRLVTVAQAFHWFEPAATRAEFRRVLGAGGAVALIWNVRSTTGAFAADYEALLRSACPAYAAGVPVQADPTQVAAFFSPRRPEQATFAMQQRVDRAGLQGRLLSSSYTPAADDPRRAPLLAGLRQVFDRHAVDGRVSLDYVTRIFLAPL